MKFQTNWLEVTYEANFREPSFEFANDPKDVLSALFKSIAPRYNMNFSDLHVEQTDSLKDSLARATLFNGYASIEVRPTGFKTKFDNPIAAGDLDTVKDCIQLTIEAILGAISNVMLNVQTINISAFLELVEEPNTSGAYLRSFPSQTSDRFARDLPSGTEFFPGIKTEWLNVEQQWAFSFNISRSIRSSKELFVVGSGNYEYAGRYNAFSDQAAHFENLLRRCMANIGLEAEKK